MVVIIDGRDADIIRKKYIKTFIDIESEYYINRINTLSNYIDGMCYTGYLWDCYINKFILSEMKCYEYLKGIDVFYVFWDIHSKERILISDYWKFPKKSVIQTSLEEFEKICNNLPKDIYVFDKEFSWSIAFTHEEIKNNKRFCYFAYPI